MVLMDNPWWLLSENIQNTCHDSHIVFSMKVKTSLYIYKSHKSYNVSKHYRHVYKYYKGLVIILPTIVANRTHLKYSYT